MSSAPELARKLRPTWVEIDLDAYRRNVESVISNLPEHSRLIAVVKADGYGHGAIELGKICAASGAAMIAVTLLEEALELRRAGIHHPLLILGPLNREQIDIAVRHDCVIAIVGPEELSEAAAFAGSSGEHFAIHLKLDSGMGRMGVTEREIPGVVEIFRATPSLNLQAIYTHFANASDPNDPYTGEQQQHFDRMIANLERHGVTAPLHHLGNSAAAMRGLIRDGDFVRVGLALLGAESLDAGNSRLEPVLRWRTEIARLKTVPAGHPIGYGLTFRTSRESLIATLPVGYADGYDRLLSGLAEVLIRGRRAPIVGRVSMDLLTIDVTGIEGVAAGDEAVLLGRSGDEEISADEIARKTGTIPYEVFCRISARVPRIYRERGTPLRLESKFLSSLS